MGMKPTGQMPLPTSPLYGRTDPETSRESAAALRNSGQLGADQALALRLVRQYPGSTCPELAVRAKETMHGGHGLEAWRQRIGRRLSEVAAAGLIYPKGRRDGCQVWWPSR